jgi:uncharacterized membrane protein YedE/YeeE
MNEYLPGLITGIVFGFLLQKGKVLRYETQIGFLRFLDMTVIKFMFSAILVGAVGLHLLRDIGVLESIAVRPASLGAQLTGGILFGIGWALFGLCPGTAAGALGEGRWHVIPGILGMFTGAAIYARVYPLVKDSLLQMGSFGRVTLPGVLGLPDWVFLALFIAAALALFRWIEKKNL